MEVSQFCAELAKAGAPQSLNRRTARLGAALQAEDRGRRPRRGLGASGSSAPHGKPPPPHRVAARLAADKAGLPHRPRWAERMTAKRPSAGLEIAAWNPPAEECEGLSAAQVAVCAKRLRRWAERLETPNERTMLAAWRRFRARPRNLAPIKKPRVTSETSRHPALVAERERRIAK